MDRLTPDEQLLADGLWYLENMARTHECIAAVLARYQELQAENLRLRAELAFDAQLAAADASTITALQAELDAARSGILELPY